MPGDDTPDVTLADLKREQDAATGGDGGGDDTPEWLAKLIDRMDEKGYLDALLAQAAGVDPTAADAGAGAAPEPPDRADAPAAGDGGQRVDAEDVATFGKLVIDHMGDVPVSELVKRAEQQPEVVNLAIRRALDGEA